MRGIFFIISAALLLPQIAFSDVVIAARTLRSQTIITASDVLLKKTDFQGAVSRISDVVGLEARVVLYQGRPISPSDVGPAAIVRRNQNVTLIYTSGGLSISADGRSLGRAGVGDNLRVMNLTSRKTVFGIVAKNGAVIVGNAADASRN